MLWSERKLSEYHRLKKQHDLIGARLKTLRTEILGAFPSGETTRGRYVAKIELRKSKPKIDEGILWALLEERELVSECTSVQIDQVLVAQAFIEGKITDDDLRAFNLGSTITPALSVEIVDTGGENDLQTDNEGLG